MVEVSVDNAMRLPLLAYTNRNKMAVSSSPQLLDMVLAPSSEPLEAKLLPPSLHSTFGQNWSSVFCAFCHSFREVCMTWMLQSNWHRRRSSSPSPSFLETTKNKSQKLVWSKNNIGSTESTISSISIKSHKLFHIGWPTPGAHLDFPSRPKAWQRQITAVSWLNLCD